MRIDLKYGHGCVPLELPDSLHVDVFEPNPVEPLAEPLAALHAALDDPLGCPRLEDRPAPRSVAIAVPDETRPVPVRLLLPPVLDRLFAAYPSLKPEDVVIVVGGGLHPPADEAQLARVLPGDLRGCRVVAHDAEHSPLARFGSTARGTPVEVNAAYGAAELRLVIGMVDAHQFVGFTGGAKGVVIGCASAAMIEANHRLMRDPAATVGAIETNPVRLDLDEAGELAGVALAVNVVLDAAKRPVAVLAGWPPLVMRAAAKVTAQVYGLAYEEPYDIVIASCGGSPKDICLYQAQKGLNTAVQCAAPGAKVLLVAQCGQGIGDEVYHDYVRRFPCAHSLKKDFESGAFRMGAHKGFLFARATTSFEVVVHSDLDPARLRECLLTPGDMQQTVDNWLAGMKNPRVAVVKSANSSFFYRK